VRLPRWTVWPAMAVLAAFLVPAIPSRRDAKTAAVPVETTHPRTLVLGIDGMDPDLLRDVIARYPERTQNFQWLIKRGGLHALGTSTPPQSPVAWSNFITGLDPGGHGIFDFIHRDPATRAPAPSTVKPGTPESAIELWGDAQLPLGGTSESNRSGVAFWTRLADAGVPADIWRMPANFPVEPSDGWSFSGMMTPAIDSAYGESKLYTTSPRLQSRLAADRVVALKEYEDGRIDTELAGPENPFQQQAKRERVTVPLRLTVDRGAEFQGKKVGGLVLEIAERTLVLAPGAWSEFVRVEFPLELPGPEVELASVWGEVRFYLRSVEPYVELYVSPVNIDPVDPVTPISAPTAASAQVAEEIGPYYTQGMPEDVNALKERMLGDVEFLNQADLVHDEGLRLFDLALERFLRREEGGLGFFYFSGVDLCSHMVWRHSDPTHPAHDAIFAATDSSQWSGRDGSKWREVIHDLYLRMDPVIGRLRQRLPAEALLIVMSDHGFASYSRRFSLNTWLLENGYLVLRDGFEREKARDDPEYHKVNLFVPPAGESPVDWTRTRAYGVGFNGLYLNLKGREQDVAHTTALDESGIVARGAEADALLSELVRKLEAVVDPKTGARVLLRVDQARRVYRGARVDEAPDLILGFAAEYDNSDASSLGRIPQHVLEDNLEGSFNGSHLMAPEVVPGVLMTTGQVGAGSFRLEDLTVEILARYGLPIPPELTGRRVLR